MRSGVFNIIQFSLDHEVDETHGISHHCESLVFYFELTGTGRAKKAFFMVHSLTRVITLDTTKLSVFICTLRKKNTI